METQRDRRPAETSPLGDSVGELEDVLSDPHGRTAIRYLSRCGEPVNVAELAKGVVGLLGDHPPDDVDDAVARRVQTWLHHGHLPTLQRHGVVDYQPEDGTVELVSRPHS